MVRRALVLTVTAVLAGLWVPATVVQLRQQTQPVQASILQPTVPPSSTAPTPSSVPPEPVDCGVAGWDSSRLIRVQMDDGLVAELPLDSYLTGVLLAEVPASFHPEALKAQAVVSRTYTLRQLEHSKHDGADICTDSSCCQAWRSQKDMPEESIKAAAEAVRATDAMVLTYDGSLIEATFFSCSGGRTEDAVAVWGSDVPYLQAVDSPQEDAPHNADTFSISTGEFAEVIRQASPEADLSGDPSGWFGDVTATAGGGVDTVEIGGVLFTGVQLRSLLGLRSTVFAVDLSGDTFYFETRGYGHRVGMSQYGAQAMALAGSSYSDILLHYYTGVALVPFSK